jgi:hypothetical protein
MFDSAQLVFIDESWTNTSMVRLRGRCPRGERLIGYARSDIGKRSLSWPACGFVQWSRRSLLRAR